MAPLTSPSSNPLRILIVDDDADTLFLMHQMLHQLGHRTFTARTVAEARQSFAANDLDLVLSDLHLDDEDGLALVRWLRAQPDPCEVIVFTAYPSVDNAIQTLRLGAADYLTKPVSEAMLTDALYRIGQRWRRVRASPRLPGTAPLPGLAPLQPMISEKQYQIGPVLLDLDRFSVSVNSRLIDTTPSELEILHYLCRHPNRVVTPQELVQSLRGYQIDPREAPEIIRPHISNLRRKLAAAAPEADVVRTVRGVGYMLRLPGSP